MNWLREQNKNVGEKIKIAQDFSVHFFSVSSVLDAGPHCWGPEANEAHTIPAGMEFTDR